MAASSSSSSTANMSLSQQLQESVRKFLTIDLPKYPVDQQRKAIRSFATRLHAPGALTRTQQYALLAVANRCEADDLREASIAAHPAAYLWHFLPAPTEYPQFDELRSRVRIFALEEVARITEQDALRIIIPGSTAQYWREDLPRDLQMSLLYEFMWHVETRSDRAYIISLFEACIVQDHRRARELIAGSATASPDFGRYREADYP